jgi:hypothetical protein
MGFWDTIKNGIGHVGKAISTGWNKVKQVGKTVFDNTVGKIPVVGKIVQGVYQASPFALAERALDTTINAGSHLLQGNLSGVKDSIVKGVKDHVNQKNVLVEELKRAPVIGGAVKNFQDGLESFYGVDELRNQANDLLN